MKTRLDQEMVKRGLVSTRSQAESYIKLSTVTANGRVVTKPGLLVSDTDSIQLMAKEQYVSRAGLKLSSVAKVFNLDFKDKVVLDVGSSTGGFTDYALQHGAKKVIAVDVGTNQLHPSLRHDLRVELHEKTDIRDFAKTTHQFDGRQIGVLFDVILVDVSFISLRDILPDILKLMTDNTELVAMVKPQFEAGREQTTKGVIKNDKIRRNILKDFENWTQKLFKIVEKADSDVSGAKGNLERFYSLRKVVH